LAPHRVTKKREQQERSFAPFVPTRSIEHVRMPRDRVVGSSRQRLAGGGMALSFRRILACIGIASLLPVAARAQESATISGHVTGEGGIALSGVAVSIPELGLGG